MALAYMNAAGTAKTLEDFLPLLRTPLTHITVGTYDGEGRTELPRSRFYDGRGSINSAGMPGPSFEDLKELLKEMVRLAHAAGKKLRVSVATNDRVRCLALVLLCKEVGVDEVELNLSCPNLQDVPILSYDLEGLQRLFEALWKLNLGAMRLSAKISPLVPIKVGTRTYVAALVQLLNDWRQLITTVVSMNTWADGMMFNAEGDSAISRIYGGIGGDYLKPMAQGQFLRLRGLLDDRIGMYYAGGVRTGADLRNCENMKADGAQVCTAYLELKDQRVIGSEQVFTRIIGEYNALQPIAEKIRTELSHASP